VISFNFTSSSPHFVLFNVIMESWAHVVELTVIIKLGEVLERLVIEYVGKLLKRVIEDHWSSASYHFTNFFMSYGFRSTSRSTDSDNYSDNYDIVYSCYFNLTFHQINDFHIDWHPPLHTSCLQFNLGFILMRFITSFSFLLAIPI
jgi:hypothetical protein